MLRELLVTALVLAPTLGYAEDPADLIREVRDRDQGQDRRAEMRLVQTMPDGFVRERELIMLEKEYGKERKTVLYFTAPADTAGTGILMHSYDESTGKPDDQWLYLPALRKTKRIATNSKEGPFLGTDFSFADIERLRVSDYQYRLKGEDKVNGHKVKVIEAYTEDGLENPRTGYARRLVYVDPERDLILEDRFFREGGMVKVFKVRETEKIEGYWTVTDAVMVNHAEGGKTELIMDDTDYNPGLPDRLFTQRALRRGLR